MASRYAERARVPLVGKTRKRENADEMGGGGGSKSNTGLKETDVG